MGEDLFVDNFTPTSSGQELAVLDDDASSLVINFSTAVNSLSLNFGNDQLPDPSIGRPGANPGDLAQLQIFNNGNPLSTVSVPLEDV